MPSMKEDERAQHGVPREVLEAERSKLIADRREMDRDAAELIANANPDLARSMRESDDELARIEAAIARPGPAIRSLEEIGRAGEDWLDDPPPRLPMVFGTRDGVDYMPAGGVAAMIGPGAAGKTYGLLQCGVSVATGTPWLGAYHPRIKGRVCLAFAEEPIEVVRSRLFRVAKPITGYARDELRANIFPMPLRGQPVEIQQRGPDKLITPTPWFYAFRDELERLGPWAMIVLDPWSRWGGPEVETDPYVATKAVEILEKLTELPGRPTVFVAHHTRKKGTKPGQASPDIEADDARGSSALVASARWAVGLNPLEDGLVRMKVAKTNHTPYGPAITLRRQVDGVLALDGGTMPVQAPAKNNGTSTRWP